MSRNTKITDNKITQILGGIYIDPSDNNAIKINIVKLFAILDSLSYVFDKKQFVEKLEKAVSSLPELPPTQTSKYIIASGVLKLADEMNLSDEEIERILSNVKPISPEEEIADHLRQLEEFRKNRRK